MNCKPGDLAAIVDALPIGRFLVGRMVTVVQRVEDGPEGPTWWVRFDRPVMSPLNGLSAAEGRAADCFLRPIRDPGDDAKDELLRPLPADAGITHLRETLRAFKAMRQAGVCP